MFITNGRYGDTFCLLARTDQSADPKHKGISCFVVEKGDPSFKVGRDLDKLGYRGLDTCELIFDNFRIPAENLVGRAVIIFYSSNGNAKIWQVWKWFGAARGDRFFTGLQAE